MHRKLKNVLSGLAMACVALVGGVLLGEPADTHSASEPAPMVAIELTPDPVVVGMPDLLIDVRAEGVRIHFATPASSSQAKPARLRDGTFQMPYFSFGATLPRAPSSSES